MADTIEDLRKLVAQAIVDADKRKARHAKLIERVSDFGYGLGVLAVIFGAGLLAGPAACFVAAAVLLTGYRVGNTISHPRWHGFVRRNGVAAYLLGHRDER